MEAEPPARAEPPAQPRPPTADLTFEGIADKMPVAIRDWLYDNREWYEGDATLRVKVANGVYWPPADKDIVTLNGTPFTPILTRDGKPVTEASGVRQKAIHVMTPTGPRSAIKTFEVVENAVIEFPLSILTAPARQVKRGKEILSVPGRPLIHDDDLKQLFLYGGVHGYGGERSEDGGRYAATHEREDA